MRTTHPARRVREHSAAPSDDRSPVLVVSKQSDDAILRRREIREAFHDSKALTITAKRRTRR